MDYEITNEVSAEMTTNEVCSEMTTKHKDPRCHGNALILIQPDVRSLMSNTSYKAVGRPKMWILLDSQSTIDVFCNGELLTHKCMTQLSPLESDETRGQKQQTRRDTCRDTDGCGSVLEG